VDFFNKQREFEAYMEEVKGMPGILSESKRDIMQHFKSFIEDFNTATMPHDKYYNFERWEMQEYQRKQAREMQKQQQEQEEDVIGGSSSSSSGRMLNDEEQHRREMRQIEEHAKQQQFLQLKAKMSSNSSVQEDMRRQAQLNTELQIAFKRGDKATVKRLERLLAPEEVKKTVKHPWA